MLAEERRQEILQRAKESAIVKTYDLASDYDVSSMTIRNDLGILAKQGHLVRIHGGAIVRQWLTTEPSYDDKASRNRDEKERIGRFAAGMIEEGMAVFIGNGTTTMEIIRHLPRDRRFRIFTNALNHAIEMSQLPQAEVFVIGGHLRGVSLAMVDRLAHRALEGIYFDLAFLGVNGVSIDHGLTIPSLDEAEIAAEVIRHTQRTVVAADHTKFGVIAHGKIADLSDIEVIISDKELESNFCLALSNLDVELYTV